MAFDVSVLIPAWRAEGFIGRAVTSVLEQDGLRSEIVIAADDDRDYLAILREQGIPCDAIKQCRTPRSMSGPAIARNTAAACAESGILAALDADDEFDRDRLFKLVPAAIEYGAATGTSLEMRDGSVQRIGRSAADQSYLTLDSICQPRIPFWPVFRRDLLGDGWPDLLFAEDLVFNCGLAIRAKRYAFIEDANYFHHMRDGSLTRDAGTLQRALRGYRQILAYIERADWPASARALLSGVIADDMARVEAARGRPGAGDWREAVRAAPRAAAED